MEERQMKMSWDSARQFALKCKIYSTRLYQKVFLTLLCKYAGGKKVRTNELKTFHHPSVLDTGIVCLPWLIQTPDRYKGSLNRFLTQGVNLTLCNIGTRHIKNQHHCLLHPVLLIGCLVF